MPTREANMIRLSSALLAVLACCAVPAAAEAVAPLPELLIDKYASPIFTRTIAYDWNVAVRVPENLALPVLIPPGESAVVPVSFTIERNPTLLRVRDELGSEGNICVSNPSKLRATRLEIVDQLEAQDPQNPQNWIPIEGATQIIQPKRGLKAGETRCFPYKVAFTSSQNLEAASPLPTIRNRAIVKAFGFKSALVERIFGIPLSPIRTIYLDASATAELGLFACPEGIEGCAGMAGAVSPTEFTLNFTIRNTSHVCGSEFGLIGHIELTESTTSTTRRAGVTVPVRTGTCTQ